MMTKSLTRTAACAALFCALSITAHAAGTAVLTEDFEADYPAWQSGWFGQHSDAMNYVCRFPDIPDCSSIRLVPDGLALWTPDAVSNSSMDLNFDAAFGTSILDLQFDVATEYKGPLNAYDSAGQLIFSRVMTPTSGLFLDPGIYEHFDIDSSDGISRIEFGGQSAGNTSIDNIAATVAVAVPEPSTWAMFAAGGLAFISLARRRGAGGGAQGNSRVA